MATVTPDELRPRLRGVLHQWGFIVSVVLAFALLATAPAGRATIAAAIYAGSVSALLGTSALYHRRSWTWSVRARLRMKRLDHSMIFVLIAGTYTPVALLALKGTLATVVLCMVWGGAAGVAILELSWVHHPKWISAAVAIGLGWVAALTTGQLLDAIGLVPVLLVALGGVLYTVGGVIYARSRPNPRPEVFGYHEIFHALVLAAAALHYAVIAFWVLPRG